MALIEADWWLYLILIVSAVIILVLNCYLLVVWQHPDDKNTSYLAKIIVIVGLSVSEVTILLLPLDVSNNGASVDCGEAWSAVFCGALDMKLAWSILIMAIFVLAFFVIPFTIFFYEEDDTLALTGKWSPKAALCQAFKYMIALAFIVVLTLALMYVFLGFTDIPVREYAIPTATVLDASNLFPISSEAGQTADLGSNLQTFGFEESDEEVDLRVDFPLYVLALMAFVGWFLFVMFGGLGLPSVPIDAVRGFLNRPKQMDRAQVEKLELTIARRCNELVDVGTLLKQTRLSDANETGGFLERRRRKGKEKSEFKKFKQMVYCLEKDYEEMKICRSYTTKYNPLVPYAWLLGGILGGVVAILWVLHIVLFMLVDPPVTPFLNEYFIFFDKFFPLLGVLGIFIMSVYMLIACVKGCFKYGLRLGFFTLHPMIPNETYMNSFLFNVGIILMCTPAVVQFTVQAFSAYAVDAEVNNLFNVQVRYLRFFRYFYANNVFIYALLIFSLLSTLYLLCKRRDDPLSTKTMREAIGRMEAEEE